MSKLIVFAFIIVVVSLLIICACLYKTNETFSNAIHYCVKRVTQHTKGKRIPELNPTQQTMQLDDAKNACTQNRRCSFFTCKDLTDTGACDKATFYHKQHNSPHVSQQDAHMMFKKSHRPCHNYCFEYMGPHKKGHVVRTEPKARTIEQAKQECDRRPECKFFTCDGQSTNSTSCNHMQMYSNHPTQTITANNSAGLPTEMYIKSKKACKTSVNAHPLQHKATQNAFTLPYAYNIHGGMKKYSNSFGGMVAMPDKVDNRVCKMNRHPMRGNNSEGDHDTNCFFLDNTTDWRADFFNMFKTEGAYDGMQPYSFYKDENHNVYHRKTDMCCADDVADAKRKAQRHPHETIELPKAHPCNNLSDSVFAEHCNGLCKDPNMIYRGDLKICVPKNKKCHYKNALTCDRNSPYKANFENKCPPRGGQGCSDRECKKHHMNVQKRSCKDGKPYYTFVGSYDETVNMSVKLQALANKLGGNDRFVLRDPDTNADWGTIHSVVLNNEFNGKPNQIKVTQNGKDVIYNVLSLSFEMQYIELYAQNEPPQDAKYYFLERRDNQNQN